MNACDWNDDGMEFEDGIGGDGGGACNEGEEVRLVVGEEEDETEIRWEGVFCEKKK